MNAAWHRRVWLNRVQAGLLVGGMLALSALLGRALIGTTGIWITLAAAAVALAFEPVSSRLALRRYGAKPIGELSAPALWQTLRLLARRAGLSAPPTLHYVPSPAADAFSIGGRGDAAIALCDGLLRRLTPRELTAVLAHELAHIARGDLRVMSLAGYLNRLAQTLSMLGTFLLLVSLPMLVVGNAAINWPALVLMMAAPHLTLLAQLGLSRVREFDADLVAVSLTGDPQGLVSALARIDEACPAAQPGALRGLGRLCPSWLRTHPPTPERVRRLLQIKSLTHRSRIA